MEDRHAETTEQSNLEALGKDGVEYYNSLRASRSQSSRLPDYVQLIVDTRPAPSRRREYDNTDLCVGKLAIIDSTEEPPEAPFSVAMITAIDPNDVDVYSVHWWGDPNNRPQKRLCKPRALKFKTTNTKWVDHDLINRIIVPQFELNKSGKIPDRIRTILKRDPSCPWDWKNDCSPNYD